MSSIQYFIAIQYYIKSLLWRQSVVGRVCLAFNTLYRNTVLYEVFVLMSINHRVVLFHFHHEIIHSFLCFFYVQLSSI